MLAICSKCIYLVSQTFKQTFDTMLRPYLNSLQLFCLFLALFLTACASSSDSDTETDGAEALAEIPPIDAEWWNSLPPEWKAYFMEKQEISDPPTEQQLEKLRQLEALDLFNEKALRDMNPIRSLSNLRAVWCDGIVKLDSIEPFAALPELRELSLGETGVSDVSALGKAKKLKKLELFRTSVADISALDELENLNFIDLTDTQVSDISVLKNMENLQVVYLNKTKVTSLAPLANLKNLTEVSFGDTKVSDITPLSKMKKLTSVALFNTPVSTLEPLSKIDSLKMIYYTGSQVSEAEKEAFKEAHPGVEIF